MDIIYSIILIYAILPNIYYRHISKAVIKKVHAKEKVLALTFDDGPDPEYTPELLDVLKKNNVKGTFFILANKAIKYPDLVKRIVNEGHNVGLHSFKHVNEAFRFPFQTKKNLCESLKVLNELEVKVNLFRPPWGIFNLLTYHYAKLCNCKIVLWSIHALDWSKYATVGFIKKRLINNVKPGDIILLHDGRGAKDAPKRTIEALETAIPALKAKGYSFILAKDLQ
jgi:peptidoglycan/xylan/chitin deacetylase (PgdA/CDA1 family)